MKFILQSDMMKNQFLKKENINDINWDENT